MSETPKVETTVWLTLEPIWRPGGESITGAGSITGMKVSSMTRSRPSRTKGPIIALKLSVPATAFMPLRPVVVIDVPESALDFTPTVTVDLVDSEVS